MGIDQLSPQEHVAEVVDHVLGKGIRVIVSEREGEGLGMISVESSSALVIFGEVLCTHSTSPASVTAVAPTRRLAA